MPVVVVHTFVISFSISYLPVYVHVCMLYLVVVSVDIVQDVQRS